MSGYCWTHDITYRIKQGDEVCPKCLANKEKELKSGLSYEHVE